ncbi:MAG: putative metal-binding motif-containing protein [Sandaracinus sp.]
MQLLRVSVVVSLVVLSLAALGCDAQNGPPTSGNDASVGRCATDRDCDDGVFCNGAERCAPDASAANGRGCAPALARPCEDAGVCNESTDACVTSCPDADGDTHTDLGCGGDDCDDSDANRFSGHPEVCDVAGHDEDCDPRTFGVRDGDGDGDPDALCCNGTTCGTDCDDTRAGVHVGATEACNAIDDDCDGATDEGVLQLYLLDHDTDGFGVDGTGTMACGPTGEQTAVVGGDCDDMDVSRHPGSTEACDMADQDCDGRVDEGALVTFYADADADGYGDRTATMQGCAAPLGYTTDQRDCDDTRSSIHPTAPEICDGLDDDCSSGGGREPREDGDGDGFAPPNVTTAASCSLSGPGVLPATDCLDSNALVHPGTIDFQSRPACPTGMSACYGVNVTPPTMFTGWLCLPNSEPCPTDGSAILGGMRLRASWDWDCSGAFERPAPLGTTGVCPRGTPGGPVCNAVGLQYDTRFPPDCGATTTLDTCVMGMFPGMCSLVHSSATMPCR